MSKNVGDLKKGSKQVARGCTMLQRKADLLKKSKRNTKKCFTLSGQCRQQSFALALSEYRNGTQKSIEEEAKKAYNSGEKE